MDSKHILTQYSKKALALCCDRIDQRPVATPQILESIRLQLEWLVAFGEGREANRERLHTLTFGHYAAREIEDLDVEFADALFKASYVADQIRGGLKVDPQVLEKK